MSSSKNSLLVVLTTLFATSLSQKNIFAEEEVINAEEEIVFNEDADVEEINEVVEVPKSEKKCTYCWDDLTENFTVGGNVKTVLGYSGIPSSNMIFGGTATRPFFFRALGNQKNSLDFGVNAAIEFSKTFKNQDGKNIAKVFLGLELDKTNDDLYDGDERLIEVSKAGGIFFDCLKVGLDKEYVSQTKALMLGFEWKFNKMFSVYFDIIRDLDLEPLKEDLGILNWKDEFSAEVKDILGKKGLTVTGGTEKGLLAKTKIVQSKAIPAVGLKGQMNFDLGNVSLGGLFRPVILTRAADKKTQFLPGFLIKLGSTLNFVDKNVDKFEFNAAYYHGTGEYSPKIKQFTAGSKRIGSDEALEKRGKLTEKICPVPCSFACSGYNDYFDSKANPDITKMVAGQFVDLSGKYSFKFIPWLEASIGGGDIINCSGFDKDLLKDKPYISNIANGNLGIKFILGKKFEIPVTFEFFCFSFANEKKFTDAVDKANKELKDEGKMHKKKFSNYGWQALVGLDFKF